MTDVNVNESEPAVPENYMDKLIREDVEGGVYSRRSAQDFRRSPMGICISAVLLPSTRMLRLPVRMAADSICASMIPTR